MESSTTKLEQLLAARRVERAEEDERLTRDAREHRAEQMATELRDFEAALNAAFSADLVLALEPQIEWVSGTVGETWDGLRPGVMRFTIYGKTLTLRAGVWDGDAGWELDFPATAYVYERFDDPAADSNLLDAINDLLVQLGVLTEPQTVEE